MQLFTRHAIPSAAARSTRLPSLALLSSPWRACSTTQTTASNSQASNASVTVASAHASAHHSFEPKLPLPLFAASKRRQPRSPPASLAVAAAELASFLHWFRETMSIDSVPKPLIPRRWLPLDATASVVSPDASAAASTCDSFIVLSYNILAQCLIRRDMYNYCTKKALKSSHRRKQITSEILSLRPDVFALQECDFDFYEGALKSSMESQGFSSRFCSKTTDPSNALQSHGCAIFWRTSRFELCDYKEVQYDELAAEFAERQRLVKGHQASLGFEPTSAYHELNRHNVAQIAVLKSVQPSSFTVSGPRGVIITNTHLFWDPRYRFVKLAQCHRLFAKMLEMQTQHRLPTLMLGDWNFTPNTLLYEFMTRGVISQNMFSKLVTPAHHGVWSEGKVSSLFTSSQPVDEQLNEEDARLIDWSDEKHAHRRDMIEHILKERATWPKLHSVYSRYCAVAPEDMQSHLRASQKQPYCDWIGEPPFTTMQKWSGTLDYLFIEQAAAASAIENGVQNALSSETSSANPRTSCTLHPTSVLEIPAESWVKAHVGLPNDQLSSDHVCVGAQFEFR